MDAHRSSGICRVAVCIASYRRPEGLRALLESLEALVFEGPEPQISVVVADNDSDESARGVCEDAQRWLGAPLLYVVEKRRGIARARNASVAPVLGRTDWIAFIDDDEVADPGWLDALLRAQRASGADVVTGPVVPCFAAGTPAWVIEGGFFAYPPWPDGAERPVAYTNNALVRESALARLEALFDESLELGEDTELFGRLARRRHRIVWADAARVFDRVPPDRTTLRWILARAYADGVACTRIDRRHRLRGSAAIALRAAWPLASGIALAALPAPRGQAARAQGLKRAAFGLGRWAGLARPR